DSFFIFRSALPQAPTLIATRDLADVPPGLATLLPAVGAEFERVPLVAKSRLPVLLRGETGTGKEMVAKAIHRLSGRAGPFVRVIAATHRDLPAMVAEGTFREDLFARISGYVVSLPPLRERREDLGLIIAALLRRITPQRKLALAPEAGRALLAHRWPGNVRE